MGTPLSGHKAQHRNPLGGGTLLRFIRFSTTSLGAGRSPVSTFIWIVLVGLVAGVIARFLLPGPNNPQGFILTAALGVVGSFVSTWIGQSIGWYRPDQGAGFVGATLGAIIVLFIWHRLAVQRVITDPGVSRADLPPPR
jgi:uncharacterized membrane protein YeaQ/YmgE (transglycosylase-associated protein family)